MNNMRLLFVVTLVVRLYVKKPTPSVKTLRSPLSAEFWRHCVLSGGSQRRALPRNDNINVNKDFISSNGDRTHNQSRLQAHLAPRLASFITIK